ncbi:MAG: outer membrane beta-barrel protein [Bacteroidota bacterium]
MKKLSLLLLGALIMGLTGLKAQVNQGKIILGLSSSFGVTNTSTDFMNIGFSTVKEKSDADGFEEGDPSKMTRINFSPRLGYVVTDNFVIGLDLNTVIGTQKAGDDAGDKYSQSMVAVGPFIRYYISSATVLPFLEVSSQFGTLKDKYDFSDNTFFEDQEYTASLTSVGGGVGIAAPLGEKVHFDVLVGYNSLTIKDKEDNEDNERSVLGTAAIKLGFTVLLGGN